ncbi:MAG: hypothetical protein ACI4HI_04520 [Lachnospiraceae bacterium]
MIWDLEEEHTIYEPKKQKKINALCDLFDDIICPIYHSFQWHYDSVSTDVFELTSSDYAREIRETLIKYQDIYLDPKYVKKMKKFYAKGELNYKSTGRKTLEKVLRDWFSLDQIREEERRTPYLFSTIIPPEKEDSRTKNYEEGMKHVVQELKKIGPAVVPCYEITDGLHGIIEKAYWGIVFQAKFFVCGNLLFLFVWGTDE